MDIRQLTYFIAVAQHRSFTKAAAHLNITQPTLSKMVKILEQELGVDLFDRSSKQIELTDAGGTILRSALQIVKSLDNMTSELEDVLQLRKGKLRLGIPPMVGGHLFPPVIEQFHSRYPQIQLQLIEKGGKGIESDLEKGELDIGFVILPVENSERFHVQPCIRDNLVVLVHPGHPLADAMTEAENGLGTGEGVRLKSLEHESFILFREDFTLHHVIKENCRKAGFEPQVVFESSQWDFMTEMVAAKFGITLLPGEFCKSLHPGRFRTIPLIEPVMEWSLSMIWSKEKYLSFAAREWIAFMKTQLKRSPFLSP